MEWLKKLIEVATITEGKLDVDGLMKQINAEFPKNAVPKETYNQISTQLKTANDTIADMKKNSGDVENLNTKIKEYETTIETMKTAQATKEKTTALVEALKAEKLADPEYFIFKQGGIDKFTFDSNGKPIGVSDVVKPFKESNKSWFQEETKPGFEQLGGGSGSGSNNPPAGDVDAQLAAAFGVDASK